MTKFTNVIVRKPGKSLCNGITSAPELGQPIYERAVEEHDDYIAALKQCGVEVTELPALEEYPDSCFVEDPAVITRCGAIITNPGADSRPSALCIEHQGTPRRSQMRHRGSAPPGKAAARAFA